MRKNSVVRLVLWTVALGIVAASLVFSHRLVERLEADQRQKMEIWAEAMRLFVQADTDAHNLDFIWKIIEENDNIPVMIVDADGQFVTARNFDEPANRRDEFYAATYARLKDKQQPIEIAIDDAEAQYIYYDDSNTLKRLQLYPYVQLAVIAVFVVLVVLALVSAKKSEQNRVWVGLSKETAHQLGTPISSLVAWNEVLHDKYPDEAMLDEMGNDIGRLKTIAERFSKIGSKPTLVLTDVNKVVRGSVDYMRRRSSQMVMFEIDDKAVCENLLCVPLFEWVIENLCKNALDAMNGKGKITVVIGKTDRNRTFIDVTDTGKGIDKRKFNTVFRPGYTTKQRGWGLGLPLARRIVEEYHGGKIFVKQSEIGCGTTFRILLK